jgi:hypothetical protein
LSDGYLVIVQCRGSTISRSELNPLRARVQMEGGRNPKIGIRYAGNVTVVGHHVSLEYRERVLKEISRKLRTIPPEI